MIAIELDVLKGAKQVGTVVEICLILPLNRFCYVSKECNFVERPVQINAQFKSNRNLKIFQIIFTRTTV